MTETDPAAEGARPDRSDRSWRMRVLLDLLARNGRLGVGEAAQALGVSEATVRRDFTMLASQQLATRTHGGLVAGAVSYDLPVRYRGGGSDTVKKRIASTAAALVQPGEVIGFNGGTTTSETARQLAARTDLAEAVEDPALTIVTNALNIATEMVLRPYIRTVSLGGVARPQSYEVIGPLAHQVLRELWLDHLILGVDALAADTGASCFHEGEASINALMVERSRQVTVVCSPEKLGHRSFARICETSSINRLITGAEADDASLDAFRSRGVDVIAV